MHGACQRHKNHLAEHAVNSILSKNIGYLLEGARAVDETMRLASHHILANHCPCDLPVVHHRITESMLDLLVELLKDLPSEATKLEDVWRKIHCCRTSPDDPALLQKWVSVLVKVLHGMQ